MIRFNVFGKLVIGIEWRGGEWRPYYLGNEGKRRDADFIVPNEIGEAELEHHLAVLFHEWATPERNEVTRITSSKS